jgi:glycosyltransferase involved in cell wall biosynthesis
VVAVTVSAPQQQRRRPTICLLALSQIEDDPRVRRQGDAFDRAGWRVIGIGLPGARSPGPAWRIVSEPGSSASQTVRPVRRSLIEWLCGNRAKWRLVKRTLYVLCLLAVRLRPSLAHQFYWSAYPLIRHLEALARGLAADIWLANDWNALPLAARLAREKGGIYAYDTHEFAVEEYAEKPSWRLWHRPIVRTLEAEYIRGAAVVSAVSAGIASELDRLYPLPRRSIVVRNTPAFQPLPFRPTGTAVRVLYHGLVAAGRGLEAAIASVAHWRPDTDLTIRGPANAAYLESLHLRIEALKLGSRIRILPAVPMTELIGEAAGFDIGLFALPGTSRHNRFALPNKVFEYIMAGLALCVSDLPEMARLVSHHGVGITFDAVDPVSIAAAINALDRAAIDRHKRASLAAARELCWEREGGLLVSAYDAALERACLAGPESMAV